MTLRLLATPLLATGLLLSTLGCSKKEELKPSNIGSYKLDGVRRSCNAEASIRSVTASGYTYDELTVYLTTIPQPTSGAEALKVVFLKTAGLTDTTYRCISMYLYTKGDKVFPVAGFYSYPYTKSPLVSTGNSGFSGVFSGPAHNASFAYGSVSEGVFTDVRL